MSGSLPAPQTACFVISLDFELMWGVRADRSIADYGDTVVGGRAAIPRILQLFKRHDVRATWATVGFLFYRTKAELKAALPDVRPDYDDPRFSPYLDIEGIGNDEDSDPYHFGTSLIEQILDTPGQEIGTHTFSHYFCLEPGPSLDAFRCDIAAACQAATNKGLELKSIVFPRDQWSSEHIQICADAGIEAFRGSPTASVYRPMTRGERGQLVRTVRAWDSILPSGIDTTHTVPPTLHEATVTPVDVPASRFLRVGGGFPPRLTEMHVRRILSEMSYAARNQRLYHLWWHPHNFGRHQDRAFGVLSKIIQHFQRLRDDHGMRSLNMGDWCCGIRVLKRDGLQAET